MSRQPGPELSLLRVLERTQGYAQRLLVQNERLAGLAASIQAEKERLRDEVRTLRNQIDENRRRSDRLERELASMKLQNADFSTQYVEVEQQNSTLASLYVATYRLHGALDREEVLTTLREIVVNLIGCEEYVILELDRARQVLTVLDAMGVDAALYAKLPVGKGTIGGAAADGERRMGPFSGECDPPEENLTACIPLLIEGQVHAVLVLFRLLGHKPALEPINLQIFDLLATHAAPGLVEAGLRRRAHEGR